MALIERIAEGWAQLFRQCVIGLTEGTMVKATRLEDFVSRHGMWGKV